MFSFVRQIFRGFALVALSVLLIPGAVFASIIGGFIFLPLPANLPEPTAALASQPTHIYDINGKEIAVVRKFDQNIPVNQSDIPEILKQAVISSEDKNFYNHKGVDLRGSFRALWADIRNKGAVQGGSTITQQYVKNAYTNKERTVSRKVREAVLASQVDRSLSKDEILYRYLSTVYFGDGAYGIGAASESYFRKPVNQLSASESAVLVGLIPAPSSRAPRENPNESETWRKEVLGKMLEQKYLTQAQYDDALAKPVWLESQGAPLDPKAVTEVFNDQKPQVQDPYYVDYVEKYLIAKYGENEVYTGGLRVQTSLDPALQAEAEQDVSKTLSGTKAPLDMALVSVEPETGFVRALVGGRDFTTAQVNLALGGCPSNPLNPITKVKYKVQVEPSCWSEKDVSGGGTGRQPGSSFKPFVLATAYSQGVQPSKVYPDPPVFFSKGCMSDTCAIHNFEGESIGPVSIKEAMAESLNTVYAPLAIDVGLTNTAEMAKKLGITSAFYSQDFHQSNGNYALGVIDVSPLDMASAYGVFANRGERQSATPVVKIVDAKGKTIEDNTNRQAARVISQEVADNVTDALQGVIGHGTAASNGQIGRPAAGKTGTTESYHDAWFVGYTPTLSTAVWMGNSDSIKPFVYKGNAKVAGGTVPTATWSTFMRAALKNVPITQFSEPAPIQKPHTDVLNPDVTVASTFAPEQQRTVKATPNGGYDQTNTGAPAVDAPATVPTTPPITPVPNSIAAVPTTAPRKP